ncbi:MAG TPA: helix-turn-helix transcriptional regulator [Gammaproteobacteria bacterium]
MRQKSDRRRRLGEFLRARRERLAPSDAGLPESFVRRRTPGLRREEVALLAGLSPTWYTWIEQGRSVSASPHALARIADALRLTSTERAYLFELAEKRDPQASDASAEAPPSALVAALDVVATPAYLLDRAWRACGWNAAAETLFEPWLGGPERNLLRYVFLEPSARELICDWRQRARRLIAEFRADTSRLGEDEEIAQLVRELKSESDTFGALWDDHAVLEREGGLRTFQHPRYGRLAYEQLTLRPSMAPSYKLVMLIAHNAAGPSA